METLSQNTSLDSKEDSSPRPAKPTLQVPAIRTYQTSGKPSYTRPLTTTEASHSPKTKSETSLTPLPKHENIFP